MSRTIIAKIVSSLHSPAALIALGVVATPLVLSGVVLRGDDVKPAATAPLSAADMLFRGAELATVGQRFTLEVFIVNNGNAPLKNLGFIAQLDPSLEHASKNREQRITIDSIAVDDLHIIRLPLTPRKSGPAGMEILLKGDGQTQRMSYVAPIAAADTPRQVRTDGPSPLKFKITSLKECFAQRSGVVLVNVVNTDTKASEKTELVVSYGTLGRDSQLHKAQGPNGEIPLVLQPKPGQQQPIPHDIKGHKIRDMMGIAPTVQHNPTRHVEVSLPSLEPGESMTLPVRLTPHRIGELGVAVTAKNASAAVLGSARLSVSFDPKTPIESLLPARAGAVVPTRLPQTLAEVAEVSIEDPHGKGQTAEEGFERISHLVEKIKHVSAKKTDAYMEAMIQHRSDVRGMPFTLGDACRLSAERGQHFTVALTQLRQAMANPGNMAAGLPNSAANEPEAAVKARIAALVQVVEPESQQMNLQMVKYLSTLSHADATRVLAKLAISAEDQQVRTQAIAALATRRDKDYAEVLVAGLNYPWPAVAERASEAIVKLKQHDLATKLVDMLDRPDPRAPETKEKDGKQVTVVREMVRVNHLRNCLLCHSPATTPTNGGGAVPFGRGGDGAEFGGRRPMLANGGLTAPVPLPNQALPQPTVSGGYGHFSIQDTLVQIDVTYLRQDFSVKLPVANAAPWPDQQRFDFLVRTRELSAKDADAYRALFPKAGEQSPYQRAAHAALRQLTGRDAEPTAAAWRQVLAQK